MLAIYKKELKSYLTSMIGYVFIGFTLLMTGIFFTAYNLQYAYPFFSYTLNATTFIYLVTTPILTMRILAEESRQKTDQMLFTAPVSVGKIIAGKYLALVTVFLIPILIIGLYPLILLQFGTISLIGTYTALIGFFLLGCANLAVGLFLSSTTESQIISAVLTFGVLYLSNYMMSGLTSIIPSTASASLAAFTLILLLCCYLLYRTLQNSVLVCVIGVIIEAALVVVYFVKSSLLEGTVQSALNALDLSGHFSNFLNDIFDVNGVVYFLSITAFFLYLTIQIIQKRRWS